ncbi:MAG: NADPH:quinone oxidoreductase family protein [Sporichthyaceae bacterium]
MRAWQVGDVGEPKDVLRSVECDPPVPGPGQLLVAVRAAAANFPDVLLCRGQYQEKLDGTWVPGLEACGDVLALGPGVSGFSLGQRVLGTADLPHGAFAEQCLLQAAFTRPAPDALDDAAAGGFAVAYQTAWLALYHRARLAKGETLLVHAAAGGVGSAAIQLGKAAGATVIAVAGNADKAAVAAEQGADVVVDRRTEDFVDVVKRATGGRGADVVFDPVGGDAFARSTKCIAFGGRLLVIGFAGGTIPTLAANHLLVKNYDVLGIHWGLYRQREPQTIAAGWDELLPLAAAGTLRPLVGERVAFSEVPAGIQRLADGTTIGRVTYVSR